MSFQTMRLIIELTLSFHFLFRCRTAFGGGWWQLPVLVWILIMLAPVFLQGSSLIPGPVMEVLVRILPLWLGYLILFLVASIGLDAIRFLMWLALKVGGRNWLEVLSYRRAVPAALVLALLVACYSYYAAYHPRLKHLIVETDKLPEDVESLRIVHLTDVHLSHLIITEDLKRMIDLALQARPDIVAVTGDLVDTNMFGREAEARLLASIKPRYGAFAIMGNHELYRGVDNARNFMDKAGLKILRGSGAMAGGIAIVGIDDEVFHNRKSREAAAFMRKAKNDGLFVLFLKHRPQPEPGTEGLFDLQLSGHTHGGQMWPGHLIIKHVNGYLYGLNQAPGGGLIYTSSGAGFWGLPMRFLARPEVVLVELKRP